MSGIINSAGSKSGVIGTTELDYEEGTWTPVFTGTGSMTVGTYNTLAYVKIGGTCFIHGYINFNASSAGTFTMTIPITAITGLTLDSEVSVINIVTRSHGSTIPLGLQGLIGQGSNTMDIIRVQEDGTYAWGHTTFFASDPSAANMYFGGTYRVER